MSNGINLIGIPKFQHPWRSLLTSRNSGIWGDRGKGNEIQSTLEKGLSWLGDKFINGTDYLEDGFNYLVTTPLAAVTGKTKEIPRVIDLMSDLRHNMSLYYAMNPVFDLVSPVKGGWMLKGLMKGSPLEKQLSKAGTVSINGLQAYLNKASKLELDVIGKILSTLFAGLKNIDYNALRKAVSDELIRYSRVPQDAYAAYGMDRLGFNVETDPGLGKKYDYVPGINTQTYTFESPRIYVGNGKHYDKTALGHSRTYTTPDEPDVLHIMESLSDWGLNKILAPYSGTTSYLNDPLAYREFIDGHKRLLSKMQQSPLDYREGAIEKQIANIERHENILNYILNGPDMQTKYLHDNYLPRQLQENMIFAAEQGLKRMRYPTSDTAAKIEGYKKLKRSPTTKEIELYLLENNPQFKLDTERFNYLRKLREKGTITPDEYSEMGRLVSRRDKAYLLGEKDLTTITYPPEHQTILKKYSDFPKMFGKLFKGLEVRTVTDPKGNTWYEVDIPENFLQYEWQFKKGGVLGLNKIIGL